MVSEADRLRPRAAGFVQASSSFAPSGSPRKPARRLAPRPNSDGSGGVSLNVLNASTQASWVARLQVGTRRNTPPRSDFARTATLPPSEHRGDQPAAQGAMVVDAPADQPLQVEAALRVAEEDEAAMPADAAQERIEGLLDVAVGREVVPSRRRPGLERRDGRLPVHGRVHAAELREACSLVQRDRADLGVDPFGRQPALLVGDRRIDVEAVDARSRARLGVEAPVRASQPR